MTTRYITHASFVIPAGRADISYYRMTAQAWVVAQGLRRYLLRSARPAQMIIATPLNIWDMPPKDMPRCVSCPDRHSDKHSRHVSLLCAHICVSTMH